MVHYKFLTAKPGMGPYPTTEGDNKKKVFGSLLSHNPCSPNCNLRKGQAFPRGFKDCGVEDKSHPGRPAPVPPLKMLTLAT